MFLRVTHMMWLVWNSLLINRWLKIQDGRQFWLKSLLCCNINYLHMGSTAINMPKQHIFNSCEGKIAENPQIYHLFIVMNWWYISPNVLLRVRYLNKLVKYRIILNKVIKIRDGCQSYTNSICYAVARVNYFQIGSTVINMPKQHMIIFGECLWKLMTTVKK